MSDLLSKLSAPFVPAAVSWRVGSTTQDKKRGLALAYIDARDVMKRLDDVVGPENWQRRYPWSEGKRLCCEIAIRIDGEWISKADGAGDTDVEAEKGSFSDAFKRAAVSWGIGRYLYDIESPWVELEPFGRSYKIAGKELPRLCALLGGKASRDPSGAEKVSDGNRADFHIPVPLDSEASGSDWKLWATTLLPDRLRVCRNADEGEPQAAGGGFHS